MTTSRGVTDGLAVIPPSRDRVERMLGGTGRDRAELLGEAPPNYGRATIEKVAIYAVMAGWRADELPVVPAAVEAVCGPAFNLHGISASTHFSAPLIGGNGSLRGRIGINCSFSRSDPRRRGGGTAGRFSMAIAGWLGTRKGSTPLGVPIRGIP